ncbi:unnamed protein product [Prorocentrum cordatum]|uniref:Uncharacterized protein n=1 Tax=Prorocentrum cordatum TaxID=2364126 RepID=A0ABN9XZ85_9DINO|nr:unnamed protein product [Polarella glacialis]
MGLDGCGGSSEEAECSDLHVSLHVFFGLWRHDFSCGSLERLPQLLSCDSSCSSDRPEDAAVNVGESVNKELLMAGCAAHSGRGAAAGPPGLSRGCLPRRAAREQETARPPGPGNGDIGHGRAGGLPGARGRRR